MYYKGATREEEKNKYKEKRTIIFFRKGQMSVTFDLYDTTDSLHAYYSK